jgi:hypothetical protein
MFKQLDFRLCRRSGRNINNPNDLNSFSKKTGLNINVAKTKVMVVNTKINKIKLDNHPVGNVEEFTCLGSVISSELVP